MSLDDDEEVEPLPVLDEDAPDVPVPVVPVAPVPEVEPGDVLAPALLPVPAVPDALLDEDPLSVDGVLDEEDDEVGGGGGGVTTVVEDDDDGGVVPVPVAGVSWRCWQAESASRMLAATAVRIGRCMGAP